ncbi:MAG TPA: PepSY domain-containing protein [Ramlibacter sp.]
MKTPRKLICALLLALAGLPAWAAATRDEAAAVAQRETGGRVLAVELADTGGGAVWRVKVVTPRGEVRIIMVEVTGAGDGRGRGRGGDGDGRGRGRGGRDF